MTDEELQLIASGAMKPAELEDMNWDEFWDNFWALPSANLSEEAAMSAVLDERVEGR